MSSLVTVITYTLVITSGALLFVLITTAAILGTVYFRSKSHKTETRSNKNIIITNKTVLK